MENFNIEGFSKIIQSTQNELLGNMEYILSQVYLSEDMVVSKKFIYAKGTNKILLVAHLDTVHEKVPKEIFYDKEHGIIWSPQGIGGDDRCGVWSILKILSDLIQSGDDLPCILFTTDEEIGCKGAKSAAVRLINEVDVNFMIELDKNGSEDYKTYSDANMDFRKFIEGFGYKHKEYSNSDISHLFKPFGVSGANLSIGYYNEHTLSEYIKVNEMFHTIGIVKKILEKNIQNNIKYVHVAEIIPTRNYITDYDAKHYEAYEECRNYSNYGKQTEAIRINGQTITEENYKDPFYASG